MNNKLILTSLIVSILVFNAMYADTETRLDVEIHVPLLQNLVVLNQENFNELNRNNLDDGYITLENCIELEIKSNVGWSLFIFDEVINNSTEFLLSSNSSKFVPLSHSKTKFASSIRPTSSTILSIDCRRIVNWENSSVREWNVSPIFELTPLNKY